MNKELQAIQNELNAILEEGNKKIEEFMKEVQTAELAEKQSNSDFIKAREEMNPTAYAKAAADKRTANDIAGLYKSKIEEVTNEPLITEQEYKDYTKQITSELDKVNDAGRKKLRNYSRN